MKSMNHNTDDPRSIRNTSFYAQNNVDNLVFFIPILHSCFNLPTFIQIVRSLKN